MANFREICRKKNEPVFTGSWEVRRVEERWIRSAPRLSGSDLKPAFLMRIRRRRIQSRGKIGSQGIQTWDLHSFVVYSL